MRKLLSLVLLLALPACTTGTDAVVQGNEFHFVSPGGQTEIFYEESERQQVPDVSGDDLMNEGQEIAVSDFEGDVVVLNVWGSWCGPCRAEAPELQKLYEDRKDDGVTVFGIDVDESSRASAEDFVRDTGIEYPSIYDEPGRSLLGFKGYPRSVVPATFVLDTEHRVAAVYLQAVMAEDLTPVVNRLLTE